MLSTAPQAVESRGIVQWSRTAVDRRRLLPWMIATCLTLTVSGCQTVRPWEPEEHARPTAPMSLAPGDELQIAFLGASELDTLQTIRRDGRIVLRILGEVKAEGKTVTQLRENLTELYGTQLQIREISILVRSSTPVFVAGSVNKPGRFNMDRPLTVLEAIMEAGGFNEKEAEVRSVVVIRHEHGKRFGYTLDFKPVLEGEEGPLFYLRPLDIVYVPRTLIVKIDQWVDQHINRLLPRLGVGVSSQGDLYYSF